MQLAGSLLTGPVVRGHRDSKLQSILVIGFWKKCTFVGCNLLLKCSSLRPSHTNERLV